MNACLPGLPLLFYSSAASFRRSFDVQNEFDCYEDFVPNSLHQFRNFQHFHIGQSCRGTLRPNKGQYNTYIDLIIQRGFSFLVTLQYYLLYHCNPQEHVDSSDVNPS